MFPSQREGMNILFQEAEEEHHYMASLPNSPCSEIVRAVPENLSTHGYTMITLSSRRTHSYLLEP